LFSSFFQSIFSSLLLKAGDGIGEDLHIRLDLVGKPGQLLLFVEDLNPLGVGVVNQAEGALEGGGILANPFLGILEALGHKVQGLVLGDRVLLCGGLEGIKGQQLGLGAQAVLWASGQKRAIW